MQLEETIWKLCRTGIFAVSIKPSFPHSTTYWVGSRLHKPLLKEGTKIQWSIPLEEGKGNTYCLFPLLPTAPPARSFRGDFQK